MYRDETKQPFMSENDYSKRILELLKRDFFVFTEVPGVDIFGNKVKIDAIIEPKEPELWAVKNICIGIEFKRRNPQEKAKNYGKQKQQATWYMQCKFEGRPGGRRLSLVLLCPLNIGFYNFSEDQFEKYCKDIDKIGIGTIRLWVPKNGREWDVHMVCNANSVQWSYRKGVIEGRKNKYKRWNVSKKEAEWINGVNPIRQEPEASCQPEHAVDINSEPNSTHIENIFSPIK